MHHTLQYPTVPYNTWEVKGQGLDQPVDRIHVRVMVSQGLHDPHRGSRYGLGLQCDGTVVVFDVLQRKAARPACRYDAKL
jgi:hypothetical protein